jgi:hypothetical protein
MQNLLLITGGALSCLVVDLIGLMLMQRGTMLAQQSRSQVHAPECSPGLPWLNTDQPLTIASLHANGVRLDRWTSSCIHGMHIIPDLTGPEKKSPNELMMTGVQSVRFNNAWNSDDFRRAILRDEFQHPVVNDSEFCIWRADGAHAWPTCVLIDASGYVTSAGARLYMANTHNHAIHGSDLASGEVSSLKVSGLAIPDAVAGFEKLISMDGEVINVPSQTIKAGIEGQLVIDVQLPTGYKLNPMAPVSYAVYVRGGGIQIPHSGRTLSAHAIEFPLTLSFQTSPGTHRAALDIEATFYWCREDNTGVCVIQSTRWRVPVETSATDENRLLLISATAQLLDEVGSSLSPMAPLEHKGDGSRE